MFTRILDWLTGPGRDEYLAEKKCRESAQDKCAELICEKADLYRRIEFSANAGTAAVLKLAEANLEIMRLQGLLLGQLDKTPVHSVDIQDGAVEVSMRPPHWALRSLASSFLETLDGAPNWRAYEIGPVSSEGGMLIAHVQRATGDSPVETVGKLKSCIEDFLISDAFIDDHDNALVARARALINPEMKDS